MRAIRVLHGGEEFYLMDSGAAGETRTVTILVQPGKASDESDQPPTLITTSKGMRVPAARWKDGRVEALHEMPAERLEVYKIIIGKYMKDLLEGDRTRGAAFFYNCTGNDFQYSLYDSHPHGLVVNVYSRKGPAEKNALGKDGEGHAVETRKTNNLCELLTRAANEGYAGAILNDSDPIYFCLDENETIRFLRLSQNEEEEIEESLLEKDGRWSPLPSDRDLELYVNQDACDMTMVRLLGDIPFLGEEGGGSFSTIEDPERPGHPESFEMESYETSAPGERMAVVFHGRRSTLEFMASRAPAPGDSTRDCSEPADSGFAAAAENGSDPAGIDRSRKRPEDIDRSRKRPIDFDIVAITDLEKLVKSAARENLVVVLEPGGHRARSGVFWLNGDEVILDSFSGLWTLDREKGFVHLP